MSYSVRDPEFTCCVGKPGAEKTVSIHVTLDKTIFLLDLIEQRGSKFGPREIRDALIVLMGQDQYDTVKDRLDFATSGSILKGIREHIIRVSQGGQ